MKLEDQTLGPDHLLHIPPPRMALWDSCQMEVRDLRTTNACISMGSGISPRDWKATLKRGNTVSGPPEILEEKSRVRWSERFLLKMDVELAAVLNLLLFSAQALRIILQIGSEQVRQLKRFAGYDDGLEVCVGYTSALQLSRIARGHRNHYSGVRVVSSNARHESAKRVLCFGHICFWYFCLLRPFDFSLLLLYGS